MANFLFDLVSNLALFAIVLIACALYNRFTPGPAINGAHVFAALALAAFVLDAALTFLVFADAQNRYGQFSTPAAFFARAGAYVFAIVAAFAWHHVAHRKRSAKIRADEALVIRTSPYSESHLRM
jgi:chromate transport protein ChrA